MLAFVSKNFIYIRLKYHKSKLAPFTNLYTDKISFRKTFEIAPDYFIDEKQLRESCNRKRRSSQRSGHSASPFQEVPSSRRSKGPSRRYSSPSFSEKRG